MSPVNPGSHWHKKSRPFSVQVPLTHGLGLHGDGGSSIKLEKEHARKLISVEEKRIRMKTISIVCERFLLRV